jgi:hypothetical protein
MHPQAGGRYLWCGVRSDNYRGDTTFAVRDDPRALPDLYLGIVSGRWLGDLLKAPARPGLPLFSVHRSPRAASAPIRTLLPVI